MSSNQSEIFDLIDELQSKLEALQEQVQKLEAKVNDFLKRN